MLFPVLTAFAYGVAISFLGSLPPGTLNVTAMQISAKHTPGNAAKYAVGVSLIEVLYLRLTLSLLSNILQIPASVTIFRVITIIFLVILAVTAFFAKVPRDKAENKTHTHSQFFWRGMLMSLVNPLQIVFWAGWIAVLASTGLVHHTTAWYNVFAIGSGFGTFVALSVYIFIGRQFTNIIGNNGLWVNRICAIFFLCLALYQVYTLFEIH